MAAYKAAVDEGADGFECDVRITKDNQLVLWHDADMQRVAGNSARIADSTLKEIKSHYQQAITLDELLILARDNKKELAIETKHPAKYLQHLHLQGLAVSSIARKISAIKSFYRFLSSENIVNTNNASNLEAPKISKKIPDFLTEKEMLKILEFADKDNSDFGIKLSVILEILYSSGLRVSELVSLKMDNLQFLMNDSKRVGLENYFLIKGKGGKERMVPMTTAVISYSRTNASSNRN